MKFKISCIIKLITSEVRIIEAKNPDIAVNEFLRQLRAELGLQDSDITDIKIDPVFHWG